MDSLWKLPPTDLQPGEGAWQVQSEEGLGPAGAVFVPLRKDAGGWAFVAPAQSALPLTRVDDSAWTAVPLPDAPGADHFLCLLCYDQPAEHAGKVYFTLKLAALPAGDGLPTEVSARDLREAFERVRDRADLDLDLLVVPAVPAARAAAQARGFASGEDAEAAPSELEFAFCSCQYPAGMLDRRVAYRAYGALAEYLQAPGQALPQRLLLLGDQVYADATYGLLDPARADDRYRLAYDEFGSRASGPFAQLPQTLLARRRMTPDDHEIEDNWEPAGPGSMELLAAALPQFWRFQRREQQRTNLHLVERGPGWRLFMADSRTRRDPRNESTLATALMLGEQQTSELHDWLAEPAPDALKIVTCASMLLPRARINMDAPLYLDTWQGYPASLHGLLAWLCEHQVRDVVFLSGDAHLACDARVRVVNTRTGKAVDFAALHAPPLYAPYPFANEEVANLLWQDDFTFTVERESYRCTVEARRFEAPAGGCGLLWARRGPQGWTCGMEVLVPVERRRGEGPAQAAPAPRYEIRTPCSAAM
jgi:hypothetical protein